MGQGSLTGSKRAPRGVHTLTNEFWDQGSVEEDVEFVLFHDFDKYTNKKKKNK